MRLLLFALLRTRLQVNQKDILLWERLSVQISGLTFNIFIQSISDEGYLMAKLDCLRCYYILFLPTAALLVPHELKLCPTSTDLHLNIHSGHLEDAFIQSDLQ